MTPTPAPERPRVGADVADALTPYVARLLTWFYDTAQPDPAVLSHFGRTVWAPEVGRSLSIGPSGPPGVKGVLVVNSTEYVDTRHDQPPEHGIAAGELEALTVVVASVFGRAVHSTWNGHPSMTGSIGLVDPPGEGVAAAYGRYKAGCPEHGSVFCGRGWSQGVGCTWLADGTRAVVAP